MLDVVRLQVTNIEAHYLKAVRAAAWRSWEALYAKSSNGVRTEPKQDDVPWGVLAK